MGVFESNVPCTLTAVPPSSVTSVLSSIEVSWVAPRLMHPDISTTAKTIRRVCAKHGIGGLLFEMPVTTFNVPRIVLLVAARLPAFQTAIDNDQTYIDRKR